MRWICRQWPDLKIENPTENESAQMDSLWREYDMTQLKGIAQMTTNYAHKWEDWAMDHFVMGVMR